jgi:hypothetical protein
MWRPRRQNTSHRFEGARLITGSHVIANVDRALGERSARAARRGPKLIEGGG